MISLKSLRYRVMERPYKVHMVCCAAGQELREHSYFPDHDLDPGPGGPRQLAHDLHDHDHATCTTIWPYKLPLAIRNLPA